MDPEQKVLEQEKELNELRTLKDSSAKLQEEFKAKEEAWLKEKNDLSEAANPNWPKARKQIEGMRAALESKGVKVDEEGNVVSNPQNVDVDKITRDATEAGTKAAMTALYGNELGKHLEQYDSESAKVIKVYYDKLTAGENVTLQNMAGFVRQAEQAASGNPDQPIKRAINYGGGRGPRISEPGQVDKTKVKGLASVMGLPIADDIK